MRVALHATTLGYRRWLRPAVHAVAVSVALTLVIGSAILAKEASVGLTPLVQVRTMDQTAAARVPTAPRPVAFTPLPIEAQPAAPAEPEADQPAELADVPGGGLAPADAGMDSEIRWFNGRPVRPARTLHMTVTAYSPDHRSCGIFADGKTATLHSVWTNAGALVAADTSILPFGSLVSVPGYDDGNIVPVLDRGGAIKGHRLDVLYPTHRIARKWGVQRLPVVVWEYADGLPPDNPRRLR